MATQSCQTIMMEEWQPSRRCGDLTNRSRIIFEIIDEVHRRVPDPSFIICVKINSVELQISDDAVELVEVSYEACCSFISRSTPHS